MSNNTKILASGTKSTTASEPIYTAISPKSALITTIVLDGTAANTVSLHAGTAGTTFLCERRTLATPFTSTLTDPLTLGPDEVLKMELSVASAVKYSVIGIERD